MPDDMTPEQVKAARALLAWSQQDLAAQSRVSTSTIADFERGLRTPVANNAQAVREALEKHGLKFMAGGVVEQAMLPPPPPAPRAGTLMRWVTSTHLSEWSSRRDAQSTLPELISRLIYATLGPAAQILFPSDESVQQAGWDGICTVASGEGVIPDGTSAWELGAQRTGIKRKADEDYEKRSCDPLEIDPKTTTFVFVTPGRFPNRGAWENAKRAQQIWRDVRVIDADILVHWLERCPAVAQWLAEKMNRRPKGLRSLYEGWEEWSLATKPALTTDIMLTDRDDESTAVLKWLKGAPEAFDLKAEAPEEAIAFLYASIARLPENYRLYHESRCVIASDANIARDLVGLGTPLIIVVIGANRGLLQRLVDDGHYVFGVQGEDTVGAGAHKLPRPWQFNLRVALVAAGVSEADAFRLSKASGRSLAILRRLMPAAVNRVPTWAITPIPELIAAMFAGGWDENSAADRKIVSMLAGKSYDEVETLLAPLAAMEGGPVSRIGSVWRLTSLHDAWPLLAPSAAKTQFSNFEKAFQQVLGTPNPRFDIRDYSTYIEREGQFEGEPSRILRQGLAEAMIALGVFPDEAKALPDASWRADRAVRQLLREADARLWWSLRSEFCELAEAAPTAFLDAVEAAFEGDEPPIMSLFRSDEGFFHSQEYLSDLLWSLEVLARSPHHLPQASLLLAHLDDVDPGGKMANRPANSLRQIFLAWTPQTYASPEQRLKVIDSVTKRYPTVGWNLLLALAPKGHDTSHPSPHPEWRDFAPDARETITWGSIAKAAREIGQRLLSHVGEDPQRWRKLLGCWASFEPDWRRVAADQLQKFARALVDTGEREALRDELRDLIQKHRNFSDAEWAIPEEELEPLDHILAVLEPSCTSEKYRWVFRPNNTRFRPNVPWAQLEQEIRDVQTNAATELLVELTPHQFLEFGESVSLHYALGAAVTASGVGLAIKQNVLEQALIDPRHSAGDIAMGIIVAFANSQGVGWLESLWKRAQEQEWGEPAELRVVLRLPSNAETWDRIAARSASLDQSYWNAMHPPFPTPDYVDFGRVAEKLMQANRSREAMAWLANNLPKKPPAELLVRVLLASVTTEAVNQNDSTMYSYYVGQILDYLEIDGSVPEKDLVRLEWVFFQALRYSQRKPRTLSRAIARNAEFFAQLVCMIYRPDKESGIDEAPPQDPEQTQKLASQAYDVMHDWSRVPGADDTGHISGVELEAWIKEARKLCATRGRGEIGDYKIGEALAAAQREPDQLWPPEPVRDVIETVRSRRLEEGVILGVINRRGVTMRFPTDGGEQERKLAERYRHDANELRFEWPRTAAVLDRIADNYEHDAKREDIGAELRDLE